MNDSDFWQKVDTSGDCWTWTGGRNSFGYGLTKHDGHGIGAHRLAWILTNGSIPANLVVCHHCDNPPCVRPEHLFLGTQQDNIRDASRKGRLTEHGRHRGGRGGRLMQAGDAHVIMDRPLFDRIRAEARRQDLNVSQLVRKVLREFLNREEKS
jgi:hypothetical protein